MHLLVTYSSKMGGTAEIAKRIADTLRAEKYSVTIRPANQVQHPSEFDAVILGSALYSLRWRRDAVGVLRKLVRAGFSRPVWLFHSGPLGDEEASEPQDFPRKVMELSRNLDVRGRATFGGRLPEDARGFIAGNMARNGRAGDWRDLELVDVWAKDIARQLSLS